MRSCMHACVASVRVSERAQHACTFMRANNIPTNMHIYTNMAVNLDFAGKKAWDDKTVAIEATMASLNGQSSVSFFFVPTYTYINSASMAATMASLNGRPPCFSLCLNL